MVKEYMAPETVEVEIDVQNGILNPSFSSNTNDDYEYEENSWSDD